MNNFLTLPEGLLDEKSILVTGGSGSFGKCFIRTVLQNYRPKRVIVFSRDELKQFEMQNQDDFDPRRHESLRYFIGDVRDQARLHSAMKEVDVVIHAAAMKHVTACEYNPNECVATNILGAQNVVSAAIATGVEKVIALSTDKASNPLNMYGASKLASDKIFVAGNNMAGPKGPQFSVVRYGNVVGSRGSVVPFFQKKISDGARSLPVTDVRMTRFWITLPQGVGFVISSLAMMQGAEIFVPKIPSMKITELAKAMLPNGDIHEVGIRPGEKLHESMISVDDARNTYDLGDRYLISADFPWTDRFEQGLEAYLKVKDGFSYSSDNNIDWLKADRLLDFIQDSV